MKAVDNSSSYRALGTAYRWAVRCVSGSVTGRTLGALGRAVRPALRESRSLGTGRFVSSPLAGAEAPLVASLLARPALALQGAVAGGAPGRVLHRLAVAAPLSGFAGGDWSRAVGAAAAGSGCGVVSARPGVGIVLIVIGLVLACFGPRLLDAAVASALARSLGMRPAQKAGAARPTRLSPTVWVGMLLALAAGVLAGAGPNTRTVLGLAVVIALAAAVLWRPQLVLLAVAAFPWMDWVARNALGGLGPVWDDALLVVSAALVAWAFIVLGRDVPRTVPVALPVLLMFAAAVASIVANHVPGNVAVYGLRVLFEPILFYFVGFLIPKDGRWVKWTAGVFIVSCTLLALHGLYQYVTHAPMPAAWVDITETSITTRAYSVVQNPNVLGGILAMGGLLSGSLALSRAFAGRRRMALAVAAVLQICGLAVTFSRGAWIGFAIGLLLMIVLAYRRYLVAILGAVVVVWLAAPRVFIERLLFSFSNAYAAKSSTGLGRIWRWDAALQHIADKPLLGLGLGTFGGTAAYMFGYWGIWVDNFYLQMGAEGGLLLLVFFLWLLLRGAKGLVRAHGVAGDPYLKALAAGMLGAFVAVVVADFFEADWETLSVGVLFWFLAGFVTSAVLVKPKAASK